MMTGVAYIERAGKVTRAHYTDGSIEEVETKGLNIDWEYASHFDMVSAIQSKRKAQ